MKLRMLDLLICPECQSPRQLKLEDSEFKPNLVQENKVEVETGVLTCSTCERQYPIINGIPRMLPDNLISNLLSYHSDFFQKHSIRLPEGIADEIVQAKKQTLSSFSFQWNVFSEMYEVWEENFLDYVHPLQPDFFDGKLGLDAGCGFGRHYYATKFGAEMVGLDPVTEYDLHSYATKIRNSWIGNHLDSQAAQAIASRAFSAVQRIAFGKAKRVRFKGKNQFKSIEGKSNKTGIRYKEKTGHIEWNGLKLKCIIDVCRRRRLLVIAVEPKPPVTDASHPDKVVVHGLSCPVKYCRILKRIFNGKRFVQLILEGKPFIKEKNEAPDKIVGLDIGPSTIAYVSDDVCVGLVHEDSETHCCVRWTHPDDNEAQILSGRAQRTRHYHLDEHKAHKDEQAYLERFCDEIKDKQKERRRFQRKLERQRRANNPQNYNLDGTIKPGKKTWHDSKRYLKTKTKLAEIQRKKTAHRKSLHGNLANRILKQGKYIKTEKLSYKAFQRNYGKSVKDRAPGKFMEILRRKAENASGKVDEFSTKDTKLSQYCHKCGKYTKKLLSQRVHTCCNLNIQRDLYSAFLAVSVVENDVCLFVPCAHQCSNSKCSCRAQRTKLGLIQEDMFVRCTHPTDNEAQISSGRAQGTKHNEAQITLLSEHKAHKNKLETADVSKRWRSMEAILQRAVSYNQVANACQQVGSFGMINPSDEERHPLIPQVNPIRDRATRLLSEDQQEEALSFIYSLKRKKSLIPQDKDEKEVSSTSSAQIQKALWEQQSDEPLTLIALKQFPKERQQRLNFLAEKNTEGSITKEERFELEGLVDETQALMLQNTETLARVIRPDLFDKKGRPIKRLITQAVRAKANHKTLSGKHKKQKESSELRSRRLRPRTK